MIRNCRIIVYVIFTNYKDKIVKVRKYKENIIKKYKKYKLNKNYLIYKNLKMYVLTQRILNLKWLYTYQNLIIF